jgi:hypothetical protein
MPAGQRCSVRPVAHLRALTVLLPLTVLVFVTGLAVSAMMAFAGWRETFTEATGPAFVLTCLGGLLAAVFSAGPGNSFSPPFIANSAAFRKIIPTSVETRPGEVALSVPAALALSSVLAYVAAQVAF